MKFKMAPNSLFAVLLRNPWWVSFGIVGAFALASTALLPKEYVAVGVMGGLPFLVIGTIAAWRQWQAPDPVRTAATLRNAGDMPWREFAGALERGFVRQAYAVTRLSSGGADFKLEKGGRVTLVSCKRWKAANPGIELIRELAACRDAQGADHGVVISLLALSPAAQKLAQSQRVSQMTDLELVRLISE